jgi:Collagen triple helix repeat (20 copies)
MILVVMAHPALAVTAIEEINMDLEKEIQQLRAEFQELKNNTVQRFIEHTDLQQKAISSRRGPEGGRGQTGLAGLPGKDGKDAVIKIVQADGKVQIISEGRVQAEIIPVSGKDGRDGVNGRDGAPGRNGVDGLNGKDGASGRDGAPGKDGKDGKDAPSLSEVVNAIVDKMKAHWAKL